MIRAFVGHSFEPEDELVVMAFTKIFNSLKKSFDFDWEDADDTQIKPLSKKVPQKMVDKNLFIGIFTKKHIMLFCNTRSIVMACGHTTHRKIYSIGAACYSFHLIDY